MSIDTLIVVTDAQGFITLHEPDEDGRAGDMVASVWRDDWLTRLTTPMTPEPAQPAESPEARALPQPSAAATAIALTAKPGDFPTDSYSLAMWLDRTMLAATTARPTERGAVEGPSKEWCLNMARLEGSQEIGAGMPDHPLRAPETATDQAAEVECREALGALVTAAAEYQEAAQQHISDTRYDEDGNLAARDAELSVVALPRARAALATQPATGRTMGGEVDWRRLAKLAGEHGVRFKTNRGMEAFLAALQNGGE